jgi:hypothetical protein
MKNTVFSGLIFVCLLISVGFAGCIGSDPIVGTWQENTIGATIAFNSDHTVTISMPTLGYAVTGKWVSQGNGVYVITSTTGQSITCQMSGDGKTMTSGYGYLQETYTKIS